MSKPAPIVLFTFRRPEIALKTLTALSKNPLADQSTLYVFSDGPKENATELILSDIKKNREVIRKKRWCKEVIIIEREKNKGLANSVIEGATEVINKHGKAIMMDEDMCPAKGFLQYMNDGLTLYENEDRVMQISGYVYPFVNSVESSNSAYFIPHTGSPSWATWKRAWDKFDPLVKGYEILKTDADLARRFDMDGCYEFTRMMFAQMEKKEVDSYGVRWWWTVFINNGLVLSPDKSLNQYLASGFKATHVNGYELPFTHHDFDKNYFIKNFPSQITVNEEYYTEVKKGLTRIKNYSQNYALPFSVRLKKNMRKMMGDTMYEAIKKYIKF